MLNQPPTHPDVRTPPPPNHPHIHQSNHPSSLSRPARARPTWPQNPSCNQRVWTSAANPRSETQGPRPKLYVKEPSAPPTGAPARSPGHAGGTKLNIQYMHLPGNDKHYFHLFAPRGRPIGGRRRPKPSFAGRVAVPPVRLAPVASGRRPGMAGGRPPAWKEP